ncbi:BQ5605_C018g08636 [Microbotryum silenes-dioicae]|uniref:BQ5605_C018g08636 protein n=1 Tax=Microbotryum silenes-dioicae TaxID=796604 RepID=A0A2X0P0C0_9BASI|nr:BQ5605_C018g08636 [Microbotryum silenes-dioicae]
MPSGPPAAPPRTFSKGTMGLKFMQRVVASQPTPPNHVPTSTKEEGVKKEVKSEEQEPVVVASSTTLQEQDGQVWRGATTTLGTRLGQGNGNGNNGRKKRRLITTSQSLLHFPSIQQTYSPTTAPNNSNLNSASSTSTSQFPLMARYSYGGANEEIELLTNPQISLARTSKVKTEEGSTKDKTSKDDSKPSKKKASPNHLAKSITATSLIRRKDSDSKGKGKGKNNAFGKVEARIMGEADEDEDEDEDGGEGMNFSGGVDLEFGSGFRKPAGMEGVKKRSSTWGQKPSLEKKRRKAADQEEEEEVIWGKRGDERAWDVGKVQEESDEEEEEDDSIGSSESSDEE